MSSDARDIQREKAVGVRWRNEDQNRAYTSCGSAKSIGEGGPIREGYWPATCWYPPGSLRRTWPSGRGRGYHLLVPAAAGEVPHDALW